jgi:hypothetical protein
MSVNDEITESSLRSCVCVLMLRWYLRKYMEIAQPFQNLTMLRRLVYTMTDLATQMRNHCHKEACLAFL